MFSNSQNSTMDGTLENTTTKVNASNLTLIAPAGLSSVESKPDSRLQGNLKTKLRRPQALGQTKSSELKEEQKSKQPKLNNEHGSLNFVPILNLRRKHDKESIDDVDTGKDGGGRSPDSPGTFLDNLALTAENILASKIKTLQSAPERHEVRQTKKLGQTAFADDIGEQTQISKSTYTQLHPASNR